MVNKDIMEISMKYTFDQLMKLDISERADILLEMSNEEKEFTLSTAPEITGKTTFVESMKRTPSEDNND